MRDNDLIHPEVTTGALIYRATPEHLRTVLFALLATHSELSQQARDLLSQRPSPLSRSITTTAPLAAFQVDWLYQDPSGGGWFRIVEIGPLDGETYGYRNVILEPVHGSTSPTSAAAFPTAIIDFGKPFAVKVPEGRL